MGPRRPRAYGLRPRLWLLLTVNSHSRLLYIPFVGNSEICGFKSMHNCLELNTPPTFYLQINQYCVFEDIS